MNRNFQDSTDMYHCLFCGFSSGIFLLGLVNFAKTSLNCLFLIKVMPIFFCGQDSLLGGQFWAMGRFNLLGGQSNLLGGQMPTQLTCYLPPLVSLEP